MKKKLNNGELNLDSKSLGTAKADIYSFGEVEVVDRNILEYTSIELIGNYYEYPVDIQNLYKLQAMNPHHTSAMMVKRNILKSLYINSKILPLTEIEKAIYEYILFGNCYFEKITDRMGNLARLKHTPAMYIRRGKLEKEFWWLDNQGNEKKLKNDSIIHLKHYDCRQEIYGIPEYLAAINAVKLNSEATMFRRKYYINGAHMGFILYMNSSHVSEDDLTNIKDQMKKSKGAGNFKNMFLHAPNAKKDDVNLIPIGEVATKDDFLNIKNASRDDILAAHRVPPGIMSIIPTGMSNFGDIKNSSVVFYANEILPLQESFNYLNELLGTNIVAFKPYNLNGKKS